MTGKLDFKGVNYVVKTTTPTTLDYVGYDVPTIWINSTSNKSYLLVDKTAGAAEWVEIGVTSLDFYESVLSIADCTAAPPTSNLGDRYIVDDTVGAVNPAWDGADKNDIVEYDGAAWGAVTPTAGALTYVEDVAKLYVFDGAAWQPITVSIPDMTETAKGVGELATDAETIDGTLTDYHVVNPSALKAKLGTQTDHGILLGSGTAAAITATAAPTDGQLLIGSTGNDPSLATLTAGTGVTVTNASGAITLNVVGGGITWQEVTDASAALVANNGYIANRGTLVTLTLPASANIGDTFTIINKGAGFVRIAQNASDFINFGDTTSTVGVGGYIEATAVGDSVKLVAYDTNEYYVASAVGNWTVA